MSKICKSCGQHLPSKFKHMGLAPGPQFLLECVAEAGAEGIDIERLYHKLYGDRLDGGPSRETVQVRICQINKRHLSKYGMRIVGKNTGSRSVGRYVLVETPESKIKLARLSQEIVARNF